MHPKVGNWNPPRSLVPADFTNAQTPISLTSPPADPQNPPNPGLLAGLDQLGQFFLTLL